MANKLNRIAGTTELSFKIGLGGFTLYSGTTDPSITPPTPSAFGFQDGDLYVRTVSGLISIYAYDTGAWSVLTGGVAVSSVFSRTGAVVAAASDYDADQIDYDPSGVTLTATDVQGAMDELDGRWVALGGPFLELSGGMMLGDITMNAGVQHLADGAASFGNPAYAFDTDDQSGVYSPAVGELGLATNAAARLKIDNSGLLTAETIGYTQLVIDDLTGDAIPNKDYVDTRPIPYDMAFYIGGPMVSADNIIGGMIVTRAVRIEANAPGSRAYALTATHGSAVSYTVEVDGVSIGTVDFATSTATGTFSIAATDLAVGQRITLKTPNPIVVGIEDVMITISGCANTATCNPTPVPSLLIKAIGNTGSNNDQSYAMEVDGLGNIYITGYQHVSGGSSNHDITTVKYNQYGTLLWQRSISAASSTADGTSIDIDSSGNVYVGANDPIGGAPQGGGTNISKYSSGGTLLWSKRVKDPARPMYGALGLKVDPASGDIFHIGAISGGAFGAPSQLGYVQRMNGSGNVIWTRKYGDGTNNSDEVNDLALDSNGDLCIAGTTRNDGPNTSGGNSSNAMVLKYDDSGALQWSKYLGKVHSNNESFAAVAVDASDNIYCGGWTGTSSPNIRGLVAKFDSLGALVWQRELGSGSDDHRVEGMRVDSVGNVFAMGRTVSGAGDNYFIIKLDGSTGANIWARRLGGGGTDHGWGAAIDGSDNIYVTGKTGLGTTFPALGANENWMMAKLPGDGSGTGTYSVITYGSYSPGNIPGTSTTGDITVLTDQDYAAVNDGATTLVEIASSMIDVTVAP